MIPYYEHSYQAFETIRAEFKKLYGFVLTNRQVMEAAITYATSVPLPESSVKANARGLDVIKRVRVTQDIYNQYKRLSRSYRIQGLSEPALLGSAILQLLALRIVLTGAPTPSKLQVHRKLPEGIISTHRRTEKDSKMFALYDDETQH